MISRTAIVSTAQNEKAPKSTTGAKAVLLESPAWKIIDHRTSDSWAVLRVRNAVEKVHGFLTVCQGQGPETKVGCRVGNATKAELDGVNSGVDKYLAEFELSQG